MQEVEASFESNGAILSGTFCYPDEPGPFPTALWIQGSGNIDRDDNLPGQPLNNSKTLAHFLAEHRIASFRYDKRGVGKSSGDYYSAGHTDLVADALNCMKFLSEHSQCNEKLLFAIGHSEGSIIAPQLSQQFSKLAGIVLLAPFIEKAEPLLMRQATVLKRMIGAQTGIKALLIKAYFTLFDPVRGQKRFLAKLKHSNKRAGRIGFRKTPLHWFREFLDLDPELIFKNTICPTLAIAGSKDFQCRPEDLAAIEAVIAGPIESHLIRDMSHLLRNEPGDPSVFNYAKQIKQPLLPEVQELILEWLNSHIEAEMASSSQPV